ncbi:MAG: DUF6449 domain-containing protein [Lachnospiraceae bacterium]|nr:DUF6449 domain-containing protein [Lachnospiraceae bacterium]
MMSKKLSGKILFERLLHQELLRTVWAAGLVIIALICVLPVGVALELGQYSQEISIMPDNILMEFMSQNQILYILTFLLGIFFAVLEFGYLFQRSKVDFYHSLPISRSMQFFCRFLMGFLLFAVPFLVLYGVTVLVGIAHGAMIIGYMKELAVLALMYLVFYWVFYSVSVIAVLLSGSYLSSVVTLLFIHFACPCFCQLVKGCQAMFFRTYVDTGKPLLYGGGSAVTICTEVLERYNMTGYYDTFSLTILTAMAILLPAAGVLLFLLRPAEKTGCGLAYPLAGPVMRFLSVTGVGIMIGLFLKGMSYNNSDFWLFCGIIAGCAIMHCVMQMVLQMNFRAFFQAKLSMLICMVCAVIFMCVFRFDLTGYDEYMPEAKQLESVGISVSDLEYYRSYAKEYTADEYTRMLNANMVFGSTYTTQEQCSSLAQMNLKNVQPVLSLAYVSIQDKSWSDYGNITVCYQLKNGRRIFRQYYVSLKDNLSEFSEIFVMDRYKESLFPVLTRGEENCTVWLNDGYSENKKKLTLEDTQYISLLRTYKRELKDLSMETMEKEEPLLLIEFAVSQDDCYNSYPVYPSFEHTLTLLTGYGYTSTAGPDTVYKARILYEMTADETDDSGNLKGPEGSSFEEWDAAGSATGQYATLWTDDEKQLEELKPYLVSTYYSSNNLTLQDTEPGFYVTGYMTDKSTGEEMVAEFLIKKGKLPEFLNQMKKSADKSVG